MINLLPLSEKKKILTEYRLRLGVVSVFAVAGLVLASLALLGPSYFLSISKHTLVSSDLARLEAAHVGVPQAGDAVTEIKVVNKKVDIFLKTEKVPHLVFSETILKIIATKGAQVKIIGFMYDAVPDRERVTLSGVAASRDSLAQFVEALKKDTTFTTVTLPISSYVKSTDIDFSIVLERMFTTPGKK